MVEPNGTVKAKNFSAKCRYLTIKDNEKFMFIDDPPEPAPPLDPVESIFLRDYNTGFSLLSAKTAADVYLCENDGIIWADGVWYKTNQYGIYERYSTNGAAGDVHMRKSVQEYLSSTIERFQNNYKKTKDWCDLISQCTGTASFFAYTLANHITSLNPKFQAKP